MNDNSTLISFAFALIALIPSNQGVAQTSFENQTIDDNFNSPAGVYSADIDMDGDIDVLAGSGASGIILWINEGGNPVNWSRQVVDLASGVCLTVSVADIVRDGRPDIVAASTDKDQIIYYKNLGGDPISWSKHIISTDVGEPHEIFVCDFDMDGNQDVFAASMGSNEISWWHNDGGDPAQWTMQVISGNEPGARSVHVADIDGDGDNDIAGAIYDTDEVVWWKNEGGSPVNWTRNVLSDSFDGSHRIQIADMDSDGDMDILGTAYMASEISIWRNDDRAGNNWTKHIVDNAFTGAVIAYAVDIDSDGLLDVLGTAQASNQVAWYENKGEIDPSFKKTVLTDDFDGVWPAHAGDYDNDFDIDLLVGGFDANEIRWYKNEQVGRFTNNIKIDGVPTNLGFFVPEEYDPNQAYKLIVGLHICGDENEYSRYRDNLIQLCLELNAILVAPDCHNSVTNIVLPEASYILEAIEYATKRFNIDEEYVYLTGGSCNGRTTLKYGLEKIFDFRGVIPFNSYLPEWTDGYFDFTSDMPVCFASGTADPSYANCQEAYDLLMQNQGRARFVSMHGVGHDFYFPEFTNVMLQCINYIDSIAGSTSSTGKVLEVPGDFQSISEAIAAANAHDTILVAPGTYYENLNFSGKDIVLASNYVFTKDLRDIENTVIDGSSPDNPDSASCLIFCKGESRSAVIEGFTITDGSGSDWIDPQFPSYTWHSGGGIFIYLSSPTIKNNIIIGNHCDDDTGVSGASGGGILTYGGNPLIINNKIQYNSARYGAGIVIDYSGCVIKNNIISNNKGPKIYGGAAFWTIGDGTLPAIIENNTIVNNETTLSGGAFYIWSSHIVARNNIIWGNRQGYGDAIHFFEGGTIDISYSIIEGGFDGIGNLDFDPDFSGPMLELTPGSPCIDAGNPGLEYNDLEDAQNPGMALLPSQGTVTNDMGVFGGPNCLNMTSNTSGLNDKTETQKNHIHCFPNPFTEQTEIQFNLERSSNIELIIVDQQGRTIILLDKGLRSQGIHSMNWDGTDTSGTRLSAGIYYSLLNVNQESSISGKIIISH